MEESQFRKNEKMRELAFEADRVISSGELFCSDIEDDPWIAFHGTTSSFERAIDSQGLVPQAALISKSEIKRVVKVFDAIHWAGRSTAGLAVLKPFSLQHDLAESELKPISFGEISYRASLFATRDFAGGESARALRYSLRDLEAFLSDSQLRESNLKRLRWGSTRISKVHISIRTSSASPTSAGWQAN